MSSHACMGVPSSGINDSIRSTTARWSGGRLPLLLTARQNSASLLSASAGPPRARPSASITALTAPADVPETPSITSRPSLKRCSSTPQVKAPCAPPPCSARLMRLVVGAPFPPAARPGNSAASGFFMTMRASRLRGQRYRAVAKIHSAVQPPSIDRLAPVIAFATSEQR